MRRLRIALSFLGMTLAFVLYQNFGVILHSEINEQVSKSYTPKKYHYDPSKSTEHIEDFYSKNTAFVESLNKQNKYFNHKKFLKEKWENTRIYGRLKNWVEVSDSELEEPVQSEAEATSDVDETDEMKIKVDPLKTRAMVRYIGSFNADVSYVQNESDVQVKVYKNLDPNSQIELQHNANDEKTWIQYRLNW
ncbi:MAG: hypothetical protein KDD37_11345 [Bdellovibrionales bacterium]|nr:hypothetical protein [Bdellovibrionales bacterium]